MFVQLSKQGSRWKTAEFPSQISHIFLNCFPLSLTKMFPQNLHNKLQTCLVCIRAIPFVFLRGGQIGIFRRPPLTFFIFFADPPSHIFFFRRPPSHIFPGPPPRIFFRDPPPRIFFSVTPPPAYFFPGTPPPTYFNFSADPPSHIFI